MIKCFDDNFQRYDKEEKSHYINYIDCGYINAQKNWFHKHRFLDKYELIYVTKGTLFLNISDKYIDLCENQFMIIPPYKIIQGNKISGTETSFYWIDFSTDYLDELNIITQQPCNISFLENSNMFNDLINYSIQRNQHLCDSFLLIILNEIHNSHTDDSPGKLLLHKINNHIEENISQPITAESLSKAINYNKDYLSRIVKRYYGLSLKDYINSYKLNLSKKLLNTSNYTIREISEYLGYTDSNLFTKFFKYHTNMTPLEFRKNSTLY